MTIIYIDTDIEMRNKIAETFNRTHTINLFSELFEAYKWMKRNHIPDVIVTEIDIESSMGLQALKFLASKSKLKNTHLVGFVNQLNPEYKSLALSEGADALFSKSDLSTELGSFIKFIEKKNTRKNVTLVTSNGNNITTKVKKGSALKAIIKSQTKK